jgi:glycogen debranching enzyme
VVKGLSLTKTDLRTLAISWLKNLITDEGINASGKKDMYDCVFGRDTSLTCLKILRAHTRKPVPELLPTIRQALLTLVNLQGKRVNTEGGEEPGKFIHGFRHKSELKTSHLNEQWLVNPDREIRNYDSIDSTPLVLLAIYKFWKITGDSEFLDMCIGAVLGGLEWTMKYGDKDKDFLLEYSFPINRKSGGLCEQSGTDSLESILDSEGKFPKYPIAAVEVQGEAWCALKTWEKYFKEHNEALSHKIERFAEMQKKAFNKMYILKSHGYFFAAQALIGDKQQIRTITANPLICLWASIGEVDAECIIDDQYIDDFIKRAFEPDMFDRQGGIRTMSTKSPTFNGGVNSYHNGSFWPIVNGLVTEGVENFGYLSEASKLKNISIRAIENFGTPLELYVFNKGALSEFANRYRGGVA